MKMAYRKCGICQTKSSSRWFTVSHSIFEETAKCFDVEILPGESLCSSCRRNLSRWRKSSEPHGKYFSKVHSRGKQFQQKRNLARESRRVSANTTSSSGYPSSSWQSSPLLSLPQHLLINIFSYLAITDLSRLRLTCHLINELCSSNFFWKQLLRRDFSEKHHLLDNAALSYSFLSYKLLYSSERTTADRTGRLEDERLKLLEENETFRKSISDTTAKLCRLQNDQDANTPVTKLQDQVFLNILKKKTGQSKTGFVYANQERGKPIKLLKVSQPQIGSSSASSSTLKKRSQVIEKITENLSSPTSAESDVILQTATSIIRKEQQFLKSFQEGGLNIIKTFTLKQVAELKAHMPMEMLRMIKRTFKDALGYDIFGPERDIRNHLKSMEFEYECGDFESSSGKTVSFVRVTNIEDVIEKSVNQLNESGQLVKKSNIPDNVLWILLSGDKGGKSTKLLLQFLNCNEQHSVRAARLLAIFEGDKDSYECMEKVFGPVIAQVKKVVSDILNLNLKVALPKGRMSCNEELPVNLNIKGMQNWPNDLQQLLGNISNQHYSKHCSYCCKKTTGSTLQSCNDGMSSKVECCISKCWLSLGGDWEFIARLLGLTGPNGTYFCNFCYVTIKDLEKGKPHTPWLLQESSTVNTSTQFLQRTFGSICSENEKFMNGGSVKSKANQFHNCESRPIFQAAGPVIESVSCMPLHLSLGLGKQALDLVENEAISLDNSIKETNGEASPELVEAFKQREIFNLETSKQQQQLEEAKVAFNSAEDTLQTFLTETAPFQEKQGRRFIIHTVEAVKAREKARELKKKRDEQQQQAKEHEHHLKASQEQLEYINSKIKSLRGPFQKRFDNTLEEMNLKRQVYHKGALVGNDVAKILHSDNIRKIVKVFKPLQVNLKHGEKKVFSDQKVMSKMSTMLTKLSLCFKLYSPSTPLCRHEVAFLAVRCASFGRWFPTNFPCTNLLRKFHVLTFHVPEKAIKSGTVGMEAEHCSESIHPVVNKLDRIYATTQNTCDRLALVAKSQWLQSDSTLTNFKEPKQRKGSNVVVLTEE